MKISLEPATHSLFILQLSHGENTISYCINPASGAIHERKLLK